MEAIRSSQQSTDDHTSRDPEDVILLTVIRCIGLFYGYYQIRLLCNLGSKFSLAITSIFPIFGSFIFNSLNFLLPDEFKEIPETLLYFLLIMDLPRACFLTSIALQRSECCKLGACSSSILQGVRILAPWLTMDTVIECVVLLLGYCSGIRRLEALCSFVCLSVLVNYVVLLAVFPLALRIVHEVFSSNKETGAINDDKRNCPSASRRRVSFSLAVNGSDSSTSTTDSFLPSSKLDKLLQNWEDLSKDASRHTVNSKAIRVLYANEALLPTEVCQLIQPSSFWLRGKILAAVILALAYVFG